MATGKTLELRKLKPRTATLDLKNTDTVRRVRFHDGTVYMKTGSGNLVRADKEPKQNGTP